MCKLWLRSLKVIIKMTLPSQLLRIKQIIPNYVYICTHNFNKTCHCMHLALPENTDNLNINFYVFAS